MKPHILLGALVIALGIAGVIFFSAREHAEAPTVVCTMEARQCPDGSYVGRVGPQCDFAPCPTATSSSSETPSEDPMIVIDTPKSGAFVESPVSVSGRARGTWFFEATAPVIITDGNGKVIGEGHVTAQGNWMTTDFVPFTGTIRYTLDPDAPSDRGTIIFKKDNPSGMPEHDDAREMPIRFSELGEPGTAAADSGLGEPDAVFCTMEARQCPDGSYVGRVGPDCHFAACPGSAH